MNMNIRDGTKIKSGKYKSGKSKVENSKVENQKWKIQKSDVLAKLRSRSTGKKTARTTQNGER